MRTEASVLRYAAVLILGLVLGTALHWQPPVAHATAGRLGIRHKFVSTHADGSDPTQVQPSNWNDEHVLDVLPFGALTPPVAPINGDCWFQLTGTTPQHLAAMCLINGVTRTVASIDF